MSALDDVNTLEAAAEYLKLAPQQLRKLANAKKIGHTRLGRTLTFDREDLEAYRTAHRVAPLPGNAFGLTNASSRRVRGA